MSRIFAPHIPPSANLVIPAGYALYRLRIRDVLFRQDPFRQRMRIVALNHWNCPLQNDRPVIQMLIHKVNRTPGHFHAVIERLLLRIKPRKRRQQRWMNVQNAIGKCGDELRRQQPHITSEANQVHAMGTQTFGNICIVFGALAPLRNKNCCLDPISRATARPPASATFEITTAISAPFSRPLLIDSAIALKFDPRPESRIPSRD